MKFSHLLILLLFNGLNIFAQQPVDSLFSIQQAHKVSDTNMLQGDIYDPLFLIKGKVAGASISKNGGHPGVPHHMIIRGLSSIYFSNNPVYVIDNVIGADISLLHPDDISSIEVLNNISSSSRYGNLGGNGVVVVNTKFSDRNKPINLNYNTSISFDKVAKQHDLLSANKYREYVLEKEYPFYDGGADTDYQDEMFRNIITNSHYLSGFGSVKNTSYYASISYKNQPGVVENSNSKQFGGNLKLKQSFFDKKLNIQAMVNFNRQELNGLDEFDEAGILEQTYRHNPTDPIYNSDGTYYSGLRAFDYFNPIEAINEINRSVIADQFFTNFNASYAINNKLKVLLNTGYSKLETKNNLHIPEIEGMVPTHPMEENYSDYSERLNVESSFIYENDINNTHFLNAEIGYAFRNHRSQFLQGQGQKPYKYIVFRREDSDSSIINTSINSIFASIGYNYKQRYFVDGGIRYDALNPLIERKGTLLSDPQDLGGLNILYPSISVAWKLNNEVFLRDVLWLSNFTVSAGYGEAGKENNLYTLENNTKLDFERSKEYNIRLDLGILKNRIFADLTYYNRTSYNVFMYRRVPVPPNLYPHIHDNSVEISNTGFECNISALVINKSKFSYLTGFTFSANNNEVTNFNNFKDNYPYNYLYDDDENSYIQQISQGEPLFGFYLPKTIGMDENGNMLFVKKGGGVTNHLSNAERIMQGLVLPEWELAWSNKFTIVKNIDFSFSLRYAKGHSIYNKAKMDLEVIYVPTLNALSETINEDAFYPEVSDYYLEDASYLRLDNLVVSYNLGLSNKNPDLKLKLFLGANNLLTITNYKGLDPEINYNTRYHGIEKANVYPPIKSYFFGLNFSF
ncbi:MAG: hypothetical protein DRJ05_10225 [Bacteroidetes bacterium]|nr:MAG: hypothetical protein DRJ05_10225 [Bacteroidota bacterium]